MSIYFTFCHADKKNSSNRTGNFWIKISFLFLSFTILESGDKKTTECIHTCMHSSLSLSPLRTGEWRLGHVAVFGDYSRRFRRYVSTIVASVDEALQNVRYRIY